MIIAQLVDDLRIGGKQRIAVDVANGLARLGHESHLVCSRVGGPLESRIARGVELFVAERTRRLDLRAIARVSRYIDQSGVELVHSHNASSNYVTHIALRMARSRPLHVCHDHSEPRTRGLQRLERDVLDRWLLGRADLHISACERTRDRWRSLLDLEGEQCLYVPNGVDSTVPVATEKAPEPTVIQVANIAYPKGHETAMLAASVVRERLPLLRWKCVGRLPPASDPYYRRVLDLVRETDLTRCVSFPGEQLELGDLLGSSHVGVLTSDSEAFPLSLLEYMAAALPVVVTDVGQMGDVVRRAACGLVEAPGDHRAVAASVLTLFSDREYASALGLRGRRYVEQNYSLDRMCGQLERAYARIKSHLTPVGADRLGRADRGVRRP